MEIQNTYFFRGRRRSAVEFCRTVFEDSPDELGYNVHKHNLYRQSDMGTLWEKRINRRVCYVKTSGSGHQCGHLFNGSNRCVGSAGEDRESVYASQAVESGRKYAEEYAQADKARKSQI